MTTTAYLGIDQGSSSTKAVLIKERGEPLCAWQFPVPPRLEDGRRVEQDAEGLLLSVEQSFSAASEWAAQHGFQIAAAGLALQRSGVLAWDRRDGRPVCSMMTWADTRTHLKIEQFGAGIERISGLTGLPTIPHFAAGKIHVLQRKFFDSVHLVATLDSFIIYRLTGLQSFVTEDTMAARTMLYALHKRAWSEELCRDFEVDVTRLPSISPSLTHHATYLGVPLLALLGDQQAALIGRTRVRARPLLNLGTIASLSVDTGEQVVQKPGLMTSVLMSGQNPFGGERAMRYLVEATSPVTGTVLLEPLRRGWSTDSQALDMLCQGAAERDVAGLATAYFMNRQPVLPAFPQGVPNVLVCKQGASDADRARAIVENVGNIIIRMLEEFQDKGLLGEAFPCEIDIAGGGSDLNYLMQYIADVSGHVLHRLEEREAGARGAALCAWMCATQKRDGLGYNQQEPIKTYRCQDPARRRRYQMWQRLEFDVLNRSLPAHAEIEE